jgi:hypothetical protein
MYGSSAAAIEYRYLSIGTVLYIGTYIYLLTYIGFHLHYVLVICKLLDKYVQS